MAGSDNLPNGIVDFKSVQHFTQQINIYAVKLQNAYENLLTRYEQLSQERDERKMESANTTPPPNPLAHKRRKTNESIASNDPLNEAIQDEVIEATPKSLIKKRKKKTNRKSLKGVSLLDCTKEPGEKAVVDRPKASFTSLFDVTTDNDIANLVLPGEESNGTDAEFGFAQEYLNDGYDDIMTSLDIPGGIIHDAVSETHADEPNVISTDSLTIGGDGTFPAAMEPEIKIAEPSVSPNILLVDAHDDIDLLQTELFPPAVNPPTVQLSIKNFMCGPEKQNDAKKEIVIRRLQREMSILDSVFVERPVPFTYSNHGGFVQPGVQLLHGLRDVKKGLLTFNVHGVERKIFAKNDRKHPHGFEHHANVVIVSGMQKNIARLMLWANISAPNI